MQERSYPASKPSSSLPPCTCGNYLNANGSPSKNNRNHQSHDLEASFVLLSHPPPSQPTSTPLAPSEISVTPSASSELNHGLLRTHQYMSALIGVAEDNLTNHDHLKTNNHTTHDTMAESTSNNKTCLCHDCIQKIIHAIEENTQQLELETSAYIQAVEKEEFKQHRLHKALFINAGIHQTNYDTNSNDNTNITENELIQSTIKSFQNELTTMQQTYNDYQNEIQNLNELLKEQSIVSSSLIQQQNDLLLQYNQIEYDANIFNDLQCHLIQQCHIAEKEKSLLNNVNLRHVLFEITVYGNNNDDYNEDDICDRDDNQFHDSLLQLYPMINNLRLAHRPKGNDIQWAEINIAWSQATQLLMYMSSNVKFVSQNYSIIPYTHCAQIIENVYIDADGNEMKKIYHHLGVNLHDIDKKTHYTDHIVGSIHVYFKLFHQLYVHVQETMIHLDIDFNSVPYIMSEDQIGLYDLRYIDENDETSWRNAINCIVSNLKWLSTALQGALNY